MDIDKKYYNNARMPQGEAGERILDEMNGGTHTKLSEWSLPFLDIHPDGVALDVGCGGGANIARLLKRCSRVYGVDYSEVSVAKSIRFNREAIDSGRCSVVSGDVCNLPFEDGFFDAVTAFETVYFWQDISKAFSEVFRVLKQGGVFLITNESNGVDESAIKMSHVIDGMNLYTPERLRELLEKAGFGEITVNLHGEMPWISISAVK